MKCQICSCWCTRQNNVAMHIGQSWGFVLWYKIGLVAGEISMKGLLWVHFNFGIKYSRMWRKLVMYNYKNMRRQSNHFQEKLNSGAFWTLVKYFNYMEFQFNSQFFKGLWQFVVHRFGILFLGELEYSSHPYFLNSCLLS